MDRAVREYSGFFTSAWCWLVGNCPSASELLVYVSIGLALLNGVWIVLKIKKECK